MSQHNEIPREQEVTAKEQAEIAKLREEVKSLRLQRSLAMLGVVGAILSFLLLNIDKISHVLHQKPRVQVTTDNEYLQRNGHVIITSRATGGVVVTEALSRLIAGIPLNPGSYRLAVLAFGEGMFERDFTIGAGETRTFIVPLQGANTRVAVRNITGHIGPKTEMAFEVASSGNGYLWIFDKRSTGAVLVYPYDCASDDCHNDITVSKGLTLPDDRRRSVFAGTHAGKETLLFLVTSTADRESANRLAAQFVDATLRKASGGIAANNWGYAEVSYDVGS